MMIQNQIKTAILLGLLTALLLWIGSFFGSGGLLVGLIFALVMNFFSYWFSDKIVLMMYRAKEVSPKQDFYKIVHEVAIMANTPMPNVYTIPSQTPNAFATGRNPKHAAVACTDGILKYLSEDELKAVIAHEIAHIINRDTLIQTIAATIAGVISYVAMIARWGALFGGYGGRDGENGVFELIALAVITPIMATILQLAISRSREYLADESAGKITRQPIALANALEKIHEGAKRNPMRFGSPATSSLFIANPFSGRSFINLLSTHPPMEERVKRLKAMKV